MAIFGALNALLGVQKDAWSKGMSEAGKEAEGMQKKSSAALKKVDEDAAKTGGGLLERMARTAKANRTDKKKSGEGALESVLKSGGGLTDFALDSLNIGLPAMVVDKVGQGLASVTGKMLEMRKSLKDGTDDWRSMTLKIGESIPIIGGFVTAGKNIRELFTGEQAEIEAINQATQRTNQISEIMGQRLTLQKNTWAEIRQLVSDVNERLAAMSLEGFGKQTHDVEADFKKQIEAAKKLKEEKAKAIDETFAAEEKLRKANIDAITQATEDKANGYWRNVGRKTQIGKIWIDSAEDVEKTGQKDIDDEQMILDRLRKERDAKKKALLENTEMEAALEKEKAARLARINEEAAKSHADKLKSLQEMLNDSELGRRKMLLEAAGDSDAVALEEIVKKYKDKAETALREVKESLKQRGISETSEVGKQEISQAQYLGMKLGYESDAERYKYMKGARDSIMATIAPELKFQDDLAKLQRAYDRGLITAEELSKAQAKLRESAAGGIVESIKTPEEKFLKQIQELRSQYQAGILDATQLARATVVATQGLNDDLASRRPQINLGGASAITSAPGQHQYAPPAVASPLESISKTTKDQLKATLDLAQISQKQLEEARKAVNAKIVIQF